LPSLLVVALVLVGLAVAQQELPWVVWSAVLLPRQARVS
jgi:hypothetical protein